MYDPFQILKVGKDATWEQISEAHLKATRRKTEEEKKKINQAHGMLKDGFNREKIKIHCMNFPSDQVLYDCIKKTIQPWE